MTTDQKISGRILYHVANGMDVKAALDQVLGKGTSEKLISDLYDELRAKTTK